MVSESIRQGRIGGSEVAAILGLDDRRDAFHVWCEKHNALDRHPPSARMRLGKAVERGIIDYYTDLTGRETRFLDMTVAHPQWPFMAFTPDAECIHEPRGVDAKWVAWDQRHKWGATVEEIPAQVQLQAVWYMAATQYPVWDIAAVVGGEDPHFYTIQRDLELEEAVLAMVAEFWYRFIKGGERPPIGHTVASNEWLKKNFPRHKLNMRAATEHEAAVLDEYAQVRAMQADIDKDRTRLENEIKLAIGDGEGLTWPRGKFTWRNTKDTISTDWESLSVSLMRNMDDETQQKVIAEFSTPKPGPRRIWFRCDEVPA